MIGELDAAGLAPYLAGPGAAVIVLLLVLGGLYQLIVKHGLPLVSALGKRHLDQIDTLISVQRDEGRAIAKALQTIDRRLARLEGQTDTQTLAPTQAHSPDRGA
jgi:hypothetical protein